MILENVSFEQFQHEINQARNDFEQSEIKYGFIFKDHYEESESFISYYIISTSQARVITFHKTHHEISITFIALSEIQQLAKMLKELSF